MSKDYIEKFGLAEATKGLLDLLDLVILLRLILENRIGKDLDRRKLIVIVIK